MSTTYTDGYGAYEAATSPETTTVENHDLPSDYLIALYKGVSLVTVNNQRQTLITSDTSSHLALPIDTGALVALSDAGGQRIAVVSDGSALWGALQLAPDSSGNAKFMHNLFAWASSREDQLPGDPAIRALDISDTIKPALEQNIFVDSFNTRTRYEAASETQNFITTFDIERYQSALLPDGGWSIDYDVIITDSNISDAAINLLKLWASTTGGGIIFRTDGSNSSEAVVSYLADFGISFTTDRPRVTLDYTPDPAAVDPLIDWINTSDSEFDMLEHNINLPLNETGLTDALAAVVKTVSWEMEINGAAKRFINLGVAPSADLASLATNLETAINSELIRLGFPAGLTVEYIGNEQRLLVTDDEGRSFSQLVLAGSNTTLDPVVLTGEMISITPVAAETIIAVALDASDAKIALRINLGLDSSSDALDLQIVDLPRKNMGVGSTGWDLASRITKALGDIDSNLSATWNSTSSKLEITDALGRTFTHFSITSSPTYEPLLKLAGDVGITEQGTSYAALGSYAGELSFDKAALLEGVIFVVEEAPLFGTVSIDGSGKWRYVPTASDTAPGFDQFTVRAYLNGAPISDTFSVRIASSKAPQKSYAMIDTFELADPTLVNPVVTHNPIPDDLVFEDIFVAQTHVQRLDDPYLTLVDGRYIWVKLNVTSAIGALAPDFFMKVYDAAGNLLGTRVFGGPENLPTTVDLPSATNIGVHSNDNSYVTAIPQAWVQPGIRVEVVAGSAEQLIDSFSPEIQPATDILVQNFNFTLGDIAYQTYAGGFGSWASEAMSKLPVSSYTQIEYSAVEIDHFYRQIGDQFAYFSNISDGMPGSDTVLNGWGGFEGGIGWAINMSGALMRANGGVITAANSTLTPGLGGGLGGGSIGGGDATTGIIWHEFAGHGSGLPHAGSDSSYPYNGLVIDSVGNKGYAGGEVGYNWAFDPRTGNYLPNYYVASDGVTYLARDPMQSGVGAPDGYQFDAFSDYYESLIQDHFEDKLQWNYDPSQSNVDGGFAGQGYFYAWDSTLQEDIVLTAENYTQYTKYKEANLAHDFMVDVYTLLFDLVDVHGDTATPGGDYFPNLEILPIETQGNLSAPLYDLLDGSGREKTAGDYVLRVRYSTETGIETDHLLWPRDLPINRGAFNIPNKGELVSAEFVEAVNGSVDEYLENKVVASYVNPDALVSTVFADQSGFKLETGILNLPAFWMGDKIIWAANHPDAVNLNTGAINLSSVPEGEVLQLRATWVDGNGVRFDRSFNVEPPATYEIQHQLFGYATTATTAADGLFIDSDIALPHVVAGASVVWTISNTSVLSQAGAILGDGPVSVSAQLTWPDGRMQTFTQTLNVSDQDALVYGLERGLSLAILDTSHIDDTLITSDSSVTETVLSQYLLESVMSATPIWTGVNSPNVKLKPSGWNTYSPNLPTELLLLSGTTKHVIDSLWVYGGYLVAPTSGTYTLNFTADQYARLMIGEAGVFQIVEAKVNQKSGKAIQVELKADDPMPVWIAYKSQQEGGYWSDYMTLEWSVDGATLTEIPLDNFLPMDANVFLTNGAINLQVNPFVETRDVTALAVNSMTIDLETLQQLNNSLPEGSVSISGTPKAGETLTATNSLRDDDGIGTITYQWNRAGNPITDATNSTYTLTQNDVGSVITVTASYLDTYGTREAATSSSTSVIGKGKVQLFNADDLLLTSGNIRSIDSNGYDSVVATVDFGPTNTQILSAELEQTTNGAVDISDVISQLRHIVGLSELKGLNRAAADNNADGSVDISDVISSLRQIVGLQDAPNARIVDAKGNHQFVFDDSVIELYAVAAGDADLSWTPLELV